MSKINKINVNSTDYDIETAGTNVTSTGATSGQVLTADGSGAASWSAVPSDSSKLDATKCTYQTTEPTSAISDGGVHIVYLQSEPSTKYSGYIYLIAESS